MVTAVSVRGGKCSVRGLQQRENGSGQGRPEQTGDREGVEYPDGLVLGTDCIAADAFANDANTQVCPSNDIPEGWEGLDAGPETRKALGIEESSVIVVPELDLHELCGELALS